MQKPALGRNVLVKVDKTQNNGSDTASATIVRVWSDTAVNIRVTLDAFSLPLWMTSVQLVEDEAAAIDYQRANPHSYVCYWPPRV